VRFLAKLAAKEAICNGEKAKSLYLDQETGTALLFESNSIVIP
jgi:hypothetical protein